LNIPHEVAEQYKTPGNLSARIDLHERFGVEEQPWSHWVFDQIDDAPAPETRSVVRSILEVGCGTGKLWQENLDRIAPDWEITLSDQSAGMLAQAQQMLAHRGVPFRFAQLDVQSAPFAAAHFDTVIANHMLYHVPDLSVALAEIGRVLKPNGILLAATNGQQHMIELHELVQRFAADPPERMWRVGFALENGADLLAPFFTQIEMRRYPSSLLVTEAAPLAAYVFSAGRLPPDQQVAFTHFVEQELQAHDGALRIQRDAGLFRARK
jgi:SAM-dependent methyltransferase